MFIIKIFEISIFLVDSTLGEHKYKFVGTIFKTVLNLSVFLIVQLLNMLLLINKRQNEYGADDFALKIDYGENLIDVLYVLEQSDFGGKMSLLGRLKSSHPNIKNRISRLEKNLQRAEEKEELKAEKIQQKQEKQKKETKQIQGQLKIETEKIEETKDTKTKKFMSIKERDFDTVHDVVEYIIQKERDKYKEGNNGE